MSFDVIYKDANVHGIIVAVSLPPLPCEIPASAWRQLRKEECEYAQTLKGHRQITWVGGRIAAHTAANILGKDSGTIMKHPHGAPKPHNNHLSISIAHKKDCAVALVASKTHGTVGVDIEHYLPERKIIASKILRQEEHEYIHSIPERRQWIAILLHFSIKEALYKALAVRQKRYISFLEASVRLFQNNHADINLHLEKEPLPKSTQAQYIWLEKHLITTVRCTWKKE